MKIQRDRFRHPDGYVLEYEVTIPDVVESPYLHILFHGFSRIEKHVPPVFARKQWKQAQRSVCLSFSDPIHMHTQDSCCGWFLLGEEEFAPRIYDLRATLLERHGLQGAVWHGLSSGGYAALKHCMRAGGGDLAFVISPHDDPTVLPQWRGEAMPFAHLPGMAAPRRTTDVIADWASPGAGRYLHALVSERDSYFALHHLKPIMACLDGHPSARAVMLRDGRGHGFIQDADYDSQLHQAIQSWESYRSQQSHDTEQRRMNTAEQVRKGVPGV